MSAKSRKTRTKRKRRSTKAVLKFGPSAAPTHKSKSGRTGKIKSTQLKGKKKNNGS